MSEKNKQLDTFDFPSMPPEPAEYSVRVEKKRTWPKKLAKALGATALGLAMVAQPITKIDSVATAEMYPADSIEIIQATGSETIPRGGAEWLVFGGYGQKYSVNAAQELFNALDRTEVVASVKYPNDEFTIEELAHYVSEYIQQRGMAKLNIAGVSMGTPTALMTLRYINEHAKEPYLQYQNAGYSHNEISTRKLPETGYFAVYSSPADLRDASQGSLAQNFVSAGESVEDAVGFTPGLVSKFIVSAFDGDGDAFRTLNILNMKQWLRQQKDTLDQTFNDTPPAMVWTQMRLITHFNADKEWEGWRTVLSPDTQFGYFYPSQADPTVNDHNAYQKYAIALRNLNIPIAFVSTGEPGHANTVASAAAVSQWIAGMAVPAAEEAQAAQS